MRSRAIAGISKSFVLATLAVVGCTPSSGSDGECAGKCDGPDDIAGQLESFADPIAKHLRETDIDADGHFEGDYDSVLRGVAAAQGCGPDTISTFVVADDLLSGGDPFPRLISTVCSDSLSRAGEFFIAASFMDQASGDMNVRDIEMFAWDPEDRAYRFYAFAPIDDDIVELEVEPERCEGCHTGPQGLDDHGMPMTPLMNELNRPWTHWNAEPGFASHDYALPDGMEDKPQFKALAMEHQAPASLFEEIISAAIREKVVISRMRKRRDGAELDAVMSMLRPVFCAEHLNYTSEEFEAGVIRNAVMIDPGLRAMYTEIDDNWPWEWASIDVMRLGALGSAESLDQVPVRSFADVMTERQLVANRVLTAEQVLRVKALDWENPVFSEFRCDLWRDASARFAADPPEFADGDRNLDVMSDVFDEILVVDGRSLVLSDDSMYFSLGSAEDKSDLLALIDVAASSSVGDCKGGGAACLEDMNTFGERVNELVVSTEALSRPRTRVRRLRNERICTVLERFPNRPSLPAVACN